MLKKSIEAVGRYFLFLKMVFRKPEKWKIFWKQFVQETDKLILSSIIIVGVISIFIGGVLVIQTASNLENPIIDKMYIGYMVRESLILEFCSTMVALILAGKMGSNIASEIGSMRITEQIDAMDMMGINSAGFLVLPKIVSVTVLSPLLMLMSFALGLLGGWIVVDITQIIPTASYITGGYFYSQRLAGRRSGGGAPERNPLDDAYALLGASAKDSAAELKRKYRELAKKNHPDALRAQGLPEEMIGKATERMSRINAAWATIREARGI